MGNPVVAADRWLTTVLKNDPALQPIVGGRVFGHVVFGDPITPYAYFTLAASVDNVMTINGTIIWSPMLYVVRIIGNVESYAPLEPGAVAIKNALHRKSGTNVSGVVAQCVAERLFALIETDKDGSELRHLGDHYRLHVQ